MKGLALLLKGLYPRLNWDTPEATLKSLAPGLDLNTLAARFEGALRMMAEAAERQARIEAMLTDITQAWEAAKEKQHDGGRHPGNGNGHGPGKQRRISAVAGGR